MSYEIPKNLKYEEKILFNLSLLQAVWLGLSVFLASVIFLKTALALEAKALIGIILCVFGAGFAFFELGGRVSALFGFFSKPKQAGYLCGEMRKFLEVEKIENDALYLKNNSAKAVLEVLPINFHILSPAQQQAVVCAYRDFLNSLDFPIQIVLRTTGLEMGPYLGGLAKKAERLHNDAIRAQFSAFSDFISAYIEKNSVKNRLFYIIIPSGPTQKMKKGNPLHQLEVRSKLCTEKLSRCGLRSSRLNTRQLVSLFSTYFENQMREGEDYSGSLTVLEKDRGESLNIN